MQTKFAAFIVATLIAGSAPAQAPTTNPAPTNEKPATAPAFRTAKSIDCSKQAEAKRSHGKPRKGFISTCKKA